MREAMASYEVRRISRGFWAYDLYPPHQSPLYAVGEVHGDERKARRHAKAALKREIAKARGG
jgi:hypothetical protein